jgi:hypothetical protein
MTMGPKISIVEHIRDMVGLRVVRRGRGETAWM